MMIKKISKILQTPTCFYSGVFTGNHVYPLWVNLIILGISIIIVGGILLLIGN